MVISLGSPCPRSNSVRVTPLGTKYLNFTQVNLDFLWIKRWGIGGGLNIQKKWKGERTGSSVVVNFRVNRSAKGCWDGSFEVSEFSSRSINNTENSRKTLLIVRACNGFLILGGWNIKSRRFAEFLMLLNSSFSWNGIRWIISCYVQFSAETNRWFRFNLPWCTTLKTIDVMSAFHSEKSISYIIS